MKNYTNSVLDYNKIADNLASVLQLTTTTKTTELESENEIPFFVPKLIGNVICENGPSSLKPSSSKCLGSLNPDLYRFPEEGDLSEYPENHVGRLWFSLEYDKDSERLTISLGKLRNLPYRDISGLIPCDPFIRLFLLPDERRFLQSKIRRKTCNPKFDENFTFDVSKETFDERVLKFVVYDSDNLKRNVPIGNISFNLKDYTTRKQKRLTTWKDLKKDDMEPACTLGELHCSLCYNDNLQRLTISIDEAKDLRTCDDLSSGTYAKVIFSVGVKQVKCKKTKHVKNALSPSFKESFSFALTPERLDQAGVSIQIMRTKGDRQIGRVVLGGSMFARGKALQHWQEMAKSKKVVQEWHYLSE